MWPGRGVPRQPQKPQQCGASTRSGGQGQVLTQGALLPSASAPQVPTAGREPQSAHPVLGPPLLPAGLQPLGVRGELWTRGGAG